MSVYIIKKQHLSTKKKSRIISLMTLLSKKVFWKLSPLFPLLCSAPLHLCPGNISMSINEVKIARCLLYSALHYFFHLLKIHPLPAYAEGIFYATLLSCIYYTTNPTESQGRRLIFARIFPLRLRTSGSEGMSARRISTSSNASTFFPCNEYAFARRYLAILCSGFILKTF